MPPRQIALAAAVFLAITYGGTLAAARRPDPKMLKRIAAAITTNNEIEGKLREQLRSTAAYLRRYRAAAGHYPGSAREVDALRRDLGEFLPDNPYSIPDPVSIEDNSPGGTVANLLDPPKDRHAQWAARFQIVIVRTLDDSALDQLRQHPPENWQADPGTITILSNGDDLCAIWGAGFNGRPIQDQASGHLLLVATRQAEVD